MEPKIETAKHKTELRELAERLGARVGKTPEEILRTIPKETLLRTRYPMLEQKEGDRTKFKHDVQPREGVIAHVAL